MSSVEVGLGQGGSPASLGKAESEPGRTAPATAEAVTEAAARLASVVRRTALDRSDRLSDELGVPVLLKREDQQVTRSYKVRGAYNLISTLTPDEQARGVVCASAGNHAQGVAFSCAALRIKGRVFLPTTTPRQKRERIRAIGGSFVEQVIVGRSYDETSAAALEDSRSSGAVYVHPFDDPRTIAGQGTVGMEMVTDYPEELDTVVAPVGGGGLVSGIALWLKAHYPAVHIVGVEPAGAPSMAAALAKGGPVELPSVDTFIDGAAVGRVGTLTFEVAKDLVDEWVEVPEGAVCTEMLDLYQSDGIIAEPAGALASAAARRYLKRPPDGPVACVLSGGNNDVSRYAEVVERSLLHEGLRHYFLVTFPQQPGALRYFLDQVLAQGEDIVLFEYVKKSNRETGPALVGIELETAGDLPLLLARMDASPLHIDRVPLGSPLFTFFL